MKFLNKLDVCTFLAEVGSFNKINEAEKDYVPTNEEITKFIKARSPLVKKLKDGKKSSAQKKNWRKNRLDIMKGIKAFHKSSQGKRFHRRLGRFLSTRLLRPKQSTTSEDFRNALMVKQEYLKGLNAAKQHLFVELEYFHQLEEQVDLEVFITDHAIPMFRDVELKVMNDELLNEDEISFLLDIVDSNTFLGCIEEKTTIKFAEIKKLWNSIVTDLENSKVTDFHESYYTLLIEKFLKGIKNGK